MVQLEQLESLDFLGGIFVEIEQQFKEANFRPLLESTSKDLEERHAEHYAAQTTPTGEPWKPLAPLTVKKKGHAIILRETDAMRDSLIGETVDSIREIVSEAPRHSLSFGTMDEKAPFHQDGTSRIPQREHVGFNEEFCDTLAAEVADATVELLMPRR